MSRSAFVISVALFLAAYAGRADVLTEGAARHEGTLEGYADKQFHFRTADGQVLEVKRASVRTIVLDAPVDVQYTRTGQSTPESARLLGYDASKFAIEQDGRKRELLGGNVDSLSVRRPPPGKHAADTDPGAVRPAIDLSGVEGRADLTPVQTAALQKYKEARRRYDNFVAENAALVKEMDAATGARRDKILDTLRQRKGEEAPLRTQLRAAEDALLAAFPPVPEPNPAPPGQP